MDLKRFGMLMIVASLGLAACSLPNNQDDKVVGTEESREVNGNRTMPEQISDTNVSQLSEEDIIRTFFGLINEQRADEAVAMMAPELVGDEANRQSWLEQFRAFSRVEVEAIEPVMQDSWTNQEQEYKVKLMVIVVEGEDEPIPFYGWGENPNIRWISLTKNDKGKWQVGSINTGP